MSIPKLIDKVIISPAKKHLTFILFSLGVALTFTGAIFGDSLDALSWIPKGTGEATLKIGSAVLGAGVFAAIMKSAQFTEYFKSNIHDVFYNPDSTCSLEETKQKWMVLTRHMLKDTLPQSHQNVTSVIMEKFFDNELQFHFESFDVTIDIEIQADNKTAKITQKTQADIIICPKYQSANIEQKIRAGGKVELTSMAVDRIPVEIEKCLTKDTEDPTLSYFRFNAKPSGTLNENDKRLSIERTYKIEQDISKEPYMIATFERYVKGCSIKAKSSGCKLFLKATGAGVVKKLEGKDDGDGYTRWVLADRSTLLLPGQGYIFVITT